MSFARSETETAFITRRAGGFDLDINCHRRYPDMKVKPNPKSKPPKLTDAERHARFVDTARKVGASEDPKDFDKAFRRVIKGARQKSFKIRSLGSEPFY